MALVSSSRGEIYRSKVVIKSVHEKDGKTAFYYGKVCKRLPKWADDDQTD